MCSRQIVANNFDSVIEVLFSTTMLLYDAIHVVSPVD